ncbi:GNAT family N-acetyltransferase [Cellulomonas persica]|uniref:N-acetyltransferase n=1 Tax=Cellulomonas persica TaxID=76861 RepID=A0A510UW74_9CELL|nr:GNAT family N-acetyltransferase [Cellulomonas persica]GEK18937.1 N-acetyltransferase [Cellulomonas persica]
MVDVVEVVDEQRFEAHDTDGSLLGIAAYDAQGSTVVFTHTEVLPAAEGRGVGSELVRGALDQVRASGRDVVALCPFVKAWIARHPDYQDLLRVRA